VNGVRIPDAEAQAIVSNCDAKLTFAGRTPSPNYFGYDATADILQFSLMTAKTLRGSYTITVTITKAAAVLNTKSVTITIQRP
jgi:hypothetical protein